MKSFVMEVERFITLSIPLYMLEEKKFYLSFFLLFVKTKSISINSSLADLLFCSSFNANFSCIIFGRCDIKSSFKAFKHMYMNKA